MLIITSATFLPLILLQSGSEISFEPYIYGLAVTYCIGFRDLFMLLTHVASGLLSALVNASRIFQASSTIPQEPLGGTTSREMPDLWPSAGRIEVRRLSLRYQSHLPPALNEVSCVIEPMAKVGVVGRTGSGKSTFVSALWRLHELSGGQDGNGMGALVIDNVDIRTLELKLLRSRLAIVAQDPMLFSGTLAFNLDPSGRQPAYKLENAMRNARASHILERSPMHLQQLVGEGLGFSKGEGQLVCLARAMLLDSKILVLDEATASLDNETDSMIQNAIRKHFAECTVIAIAHRLHTIIDSSMILFMERGELVEQGLPSALVSNPSSHFARMLATAKISTHLPGNT